MGLEKAIPQFAFQLFQSHACLVDFPAGGMNLRNVLTDVDVKNRADIQRDVLPVGANGKQIRVLLSGHLSCLTHASVCLS